VYTATSTTICRRTDEGHTVQHIGTQRTETSEPISVVTLWSADTHRVSVGRLTRGGVDNDVQVTNHPRRCGRPALRQCRNIRSVSDGRLTQGDVDNDVQVTNHRRFCGWPALGHCRNTQSVSDRRLTRGTLTMTSK